MDKPFQKNHNQHTDYEEAFLEDVADQIAYKPLRPAVVRELKDHIDDRTEEYLSEGMSPEDAVKKAVDAMGTVWRSAPGSTRSVTSGPAAF